MIDPTISYFLPYAEDAEYSSTFGGIPKELVCGNWAMELTSKLPATLFDPVSRQVELISRRVNGMGYRFIAVSLRYLDRLEVNSRQPFWVVFSSDEQTAEVIERWRGEQPYKALHVSKVSDRELAKPESVGIDLLREHFSGILIKVLANNPTAEDVVPDYMSLVRRWREPKKVAAERDGLIHNVTAPNVLALQSVGFESQSLKIPKKFKKEADFVAAIIESFQLVDEARRSLVGGKRKKEVLPLPETFVFCPGMFRHLYEKNALSRSSNADHGDTAYDVLRSFQKQEGYGLKMRTNVFERVQRHVPLQSFLTIWGMELRCLTSAIALRASSQFASTVRLPPGVNRSLGVLRQVAESARSDSPKSTAKQKATRFAAHFRAAQKELTETVDQRLLDRIQQAPFGIKLFSDAPLEWLPSGDIPLSLRHNVSRIPVTPGDLFVTTTVMNSELDIPADMFRKILHVDASLDSNLHGKLADGLARDPGISNDQLAGIARVEPKDKGEFVAAVNAFEGPLMILDTHGWHEGKGNAAELEIGRDKVDILSLLGTLRVPPIVLLSACDTHGLDQNHATAANGFLALGAHSVIATLLPVGIQEGASFAARLVSHLLSFVPSLVEGGGRPLRWTQIVSETMRLQLAADILAGFVEVDLLSHDQSLELMKKSDQAIRIDRCRDWYECLVGEIVDVAGQEKELVAEKAREFVGTSDMIRYINLGNPEDIVIHGNPKPASAETVSRAR